MSLKNLFDTRRPLHLKDRSYRMIDTPNSLGGRSGGGGPFSISGPGFPFGGPQIPFGTDLTPGLPNFGVGSTNPNGQAPGPQQTGGPNPSSPSGAPAPNGFEAFLRGDIPPGGAKPGAGDPGGLFGNTSPPSLSATPLNQMGIEQIMQLLALQGRTPPDQLNRDISASNRSGQAGLQGIDAELARRGLQGSGLGQALRAAMQANTGDRAAGIRADDTAAAQQRQRDDLMRLFLPLLGIQQDEQALITGQYNADRDRDAQSDSARLDAVSGLIPVGFDVWKWWKERQGSGGSSNSNNPLD